MNRNDLSNIFYYSLNGGLPDDKLCISNDQEKWEVYYSERGIKNILNIFDSENDACEFMYNKVMDIVSRKVR